MSKSLTKLEIALINFSWNSKGLEIHKIGDSEYSLISGRDIVSKLKIEEENDVKSLYFIWDVETPKRYRRNGYASTLLRKVMEEISKVDPDSEFYLAVSTNNEPAINLYKKLGFYECLKFRDNGKTYYCMSTATGMMLSKLVSMYKNSFNNVELI